VRVGPYISTPKGKSHWLVPRGKKTGSNKERRLSVSTKVCDGKRGQGLAYKERYISHGRKRQYCPFFNADKKAQGETSGHSSKKKADSHKRSSAIPVCERSIFSTTGRRAYYCRLALEKNIGQIPHFKGGKRGLAASPDQSQKRGRNSASPKVH